MSKPVMTAKVVAHQIIKDSHSVFVNEERVKKLAQKINEWKPNSNAWPLPNIATPQNPKAADQTIILYELIANSANYKYWYGKQDIRPNNSSSTKLYELLDKSFQSITPLLLEDNITDSYCEAVITQFMKEITVTRMPMISERIRHLNELIEKDDHSENSKVGKFVRYMGEGGMEDNFANFMGWLLIYFPGYANDIFLKRAVLFFMMLHRRKGWFKNDLNKMIIPADYHIPNVLRHFGCISYIPKVRLDIGEGQLIPEGSLLECEIRAASIVVSDMMIEEGVNPVQLDDYLWANKKNATTPFHLTITTNY